MKYLLMIPVIIMWTTYGALSVLMLTDWIRSAKKLPYMPHKDKFYWALGYRNMIRLPFETLCDVSDGSLKDKIQSGAIPKCRIMEMLVRDPETRELTSYIAFKNKKQALSFKLKYL